MSSKFHLVAVVVARVCENTLRKFTTLRKIGFGETLNSIYLEIRWNGLKPK